MKIGTARRRHAVCVQGHQIIGPRLDRIRQPDPSEPVGNGEDMVVTGLASCAPLASSTSTTLALTIKFRYVAEITRFSSSTKLMTEFICEAGNFKWAARTVRSGAVPVNMQLRR